MVSSSADGIVVDVTGLDYMSSAGIRVLLSAVRQMRAKTRKLALCGRRLRVREIFAISALNQIFAIHPTTTRRPPAWAEETEPCGD
jgi:anti-sigma B factor antagonist